MTSILLSPRFLLCTLAIILAAILAPRASHLLLRAPANATSTYTLSSTFTTTSTTASMSGPSTSTSTSSTMSPAEFRQWNRLADGMDRFHNLFRAEYDDVYRKAFAKFKGDSFKYFIREAETLATHLDNHHRIEEAYIFPMLAKKLPQFGSSSRGPQNAAHVAAHRGIHDGLTRFSAYLNKAKADPASYDGNELRKIMDSFHDVLFDHLDEEVRDLGAESVRKAGFTLDELRQFPL